MIALIQRVSHGQVHIDEQEIASIGYGIVALIAIQPEDGMDQVKKMIKRLLNYRIFPDKMGKMNLSLVDIEGSIILVPQFTLLADTTRGNRPSFSGNLSPEKGELIFKDLIDYSKEQYNRVQNGIFGSDMQVSLINDGPVTFWLEV